MEPAVEQYLSALVQRARAALGDGLVGVYAAGSLALGAYEPGRSDIDVAVVVSDALSSAEKRELVELLRHESLPCPARGLELVVYRLAVAAAGTPAPGFELELNTGRGMDFRATYSPEARPVEDGLFWYAIDRSILRDHGRALTGPPSEEVFGAIDEPDLLDLLADSLRWRRSAGDGEAVLGACRALVRARTGRWLPKASAAEELAASGFEESLVRRAVAARGGASEPPRREVRRLLDRAVDELGSLRGGGY